MCLVHAALSIIRRIAIAVGATAEQDSKVLVQVSEKSVLRRAGGIRWLAADDGSCAAVREEVDASVVLAQSSAVSVPVAGLTDTARTAPVAGRQLTREVR